MKIDEENSNKIKGVGITFSDFNLLRAPGHLLRRNDQRAFEIFSRIASDGLTRQQFALLMALAQTPGASQNALVHETGVDKSTIREILDRMVARGWVERERAAYDKRAWTMHISAKGQRLLDERMEKALLVQQEIMAPLPLELRDPFIRCLRILIGLETLSQEAQSVADFSDAAR